VGKRQKLRVVTALPLMGVRSLTLSGDRQQLKNAFTIVKREALAALNEFEEKRFRQEFGVNLSKALYQDYYLLISTQHPFPPGGNKTLTQVLNELYLKNADRVDRLLLALNLIGKLWTFQPDIRLTWYENNYPVKQRLITYRHHYPISTFQGKPILSDLRKASDLTFIIDRVYSSSDQNNSYPGVRIALDALRTGMFASNTSIRYLQEAIAIEALTSTETQEVTHRVKITCSLLLASGVNKRERFYKQVGKIYNKRSSIIHGSNIRVKRDELCEIEQVSRKLLQRILKNNILPNFVNRDLQRQFLLELQFGKEI